MKTLFCLLGAAGLCLAAEPPLLLQKPAVSRSEIAFVYAGDLWIVSRGGGEARRLTTGPGVETDPHFSPDGSLIAFTGEYDGNMDVYTVPTAGGVPRRLTWHPTPDGVAGRTPDGKRVLFCSGRNSYSRFTRLFAVTLDGGFPEELPLPMADEGAYSPDGSQIAYLPIGRAFSTWKRYRGGRITPIWIARLSDSTVQQKIPRENSNDFNPMWVDQRVFFLSDRNGPVTLFSYDTRTKKLTQLLKNDGMDIKSASAGPGAIVYEQFGNPQSEWVPFGAAFLSMLPGSRVRRRACASHAGGRPRRRMLPRSSCSRLAIAASTCASSWRNTATSLAISMAARFAI